MKNTKKYTDIFLSLTIILTISGCSTVGEVFKSKIDIAGVARYSNELSTLENPAEKDIILNEINDRKVLITQGEVIEVRRSYDIHFPFVVIVHIEFDNQKMECFAYTADNEGIATLRRGDLIEVKGKFAKFRMKAENDKTVQFELEEVEVKKLE